MGSPTQRGPEENRFGSTERRLRRLDERGVVRSCVVVARVVVRRAFQHAEHTLDHAA